VVRSGTSQAAGISCGAASGARSTPILEGWCSRDGTTPRGQAFKDVSAAGGTVLIYLDVVIDNRYGRYHEMLNKASECGHAPSRWPGNHCVPGGGGDAGLDQRTDEGQLIMKPPFTPLIGQTLVEYL
jgi:hypothetical protein